MLLFRYLTLPRALMPDEFIFVFVGRGWKKKMTSVLDKKSKKNEFSYNLGALVGQWQGHTQVTFCEGLCAEQQNRMICLDNQPRTFPSPTISERLFSIFLFTGPNSFLILARVYILQIATLKWVGVF